MYVHDFLEILEGRVPGVGVGKRRYFGVTEPGNGRDENDAVDHGALDVFHQAIRNDDEADDAEPECGALHAISGAENVPRDGAASEQADGAVSCRYDGGERCAGGRWAGSKCDQGG